MLGTLCSRGMPLHNTAASCQFTRSNKDFFTVIDGMVFPVLYRDCPRDCYFVLTLLDNNMKPFAETSFALFDEDNQMRQGNQKVRFFAATANNGCHVPPDCGHVEIDPYLKWEDTNLRMNGSQCEWLSEITDNRIDDVTTDAIAHKKRMLEALGRKLYNRKLLLPPMPNSKEELVHDYHGNFINLEMVFKLPIYDSMSFEPLEYHHQTVHEDHLALVNACVLDHPKQSVPASSTSWCDFDPCYADGEVAARNPVDVKFNMMKEAGRRYYSAEEKPTNEERLRLLRLLNTVLLEDLKDDEKTLLWTFRHVLLGMRHALPKILYSMDLTQPAEVAAATALLAQWPELCVEDALQLLGRETAMPAVRSYAVRQLGRQLGDAELQLFLLQLVQALRYEPEPVRRETRQRVVERVVRLEPAPRDPEEAAGDKKVAGDEEKAAEGDQPAEKPVEGEMPMAKPAEEDKPMESAEPTEAAAEKSAVIEERVQETVEESVLVPNSPLFCFLCERCGAVRALASLFFHYLHVESNTDAADGSADEHYVAMESCFLATTQETHPAIYAALLEEQRCTSALFTLSQRIIDAGGRAQKKQENLRQLLATDFKDNFAHEPLLPVRFDLPLSHVLASTAKVFQSAMTPFALEFVVAGSSREAPRHEAKSTVSEGEGVDICKQCGHSYAKCLCLRCAICNALLVQKHHCRTCKYPICAKCGVERQGVWFCADTDRCDKLRFEILRVMVKNGDDVRQDQMVIQMIRLMDKLLKDVNLDLCLSPYDVVAMNSNQGLLEMVQNSVALSGVKSIRAFLKDKHPDSTNELGIEPSVVDTYVKSCAGYAVITYLLGIGDRHLDNIMLDNDGHLFHIDFGYIFGMDPKVKEATIRITTDMIDGMGGQNSENYRLFLGYTFQAYHILRRNAPLLITLLQMMMDASIKDCKPEFLNRMILRFNLDMTEEEAERSFKNVLEKCIGDMVAGMLELAHNIATSMR